MKLRSGNKNKDAEPPKKQSNGVEKAKKQPPKKAEKAAPKPAKAEPKPKAAKETKKPAPKAAKNSPKATKNSPKATKNSPKATKKSKSEAAEKPEPKAKAAKNAPKSKPQPVEEPAEPMDEDDVVEIPPAPKAVGKKTQPANNGSTTATVPTASKTAKKPAQNPQPHPSNGIHDVVEPMDDEIIVLPDIPQADNGNGVHMAPIAPPAVATQAVPATNGNGVHSIAAPVVPMAPTAPAVLVETVQRPPPQKAKPKKVPTTVKGTFEEYANDPADQDTPGKIGPNGVVRLLEDLNIDPMDRRVLIMAQRMNAQIMSEFTWEEWQQGMQALGATSVATLAARLTQQDRGLADLKSFTEVHKFTFTYGKQAGKRNLDVERAVTFWQILFKDEYPLLPLWDEFLTTVHKKDITLDVWKMFLEFATTVRPDLSNYDEEASWPSVLDSFVGWVRPKLNKA